MFNRSELEDLKTLLYAKVQECIYQQRIHKILQEDSLVSLYKKDTEKFKQLLKKCEEML